MKILEVVKKVKKEVPFDSEEYDATSDIPKHNKKMDKFDAIDLFNKHGTQLGTGAFGTAISILKDLETVVKVASSSSYGKNAFKKDGYLTYISIAKQMQDNPYVPQIHEVALIQPKFRKGSKDSYDKDQGEYLLINIEKLYPGGDFRVDELFLVLEKMCDQNFSIEEMNDITNRFNLAKSRHVDDPLEHKAKPEWDYRKAYSLIANMLSRYVWGERTSEHEKAGLIIKDPQLIEVLDKIKKLVHGPLGFSNDLHAGNIMFRRTPHGPQLVITDPLT